MLRLCVTTDCQPRTKKGQPPQRTTGAASMSSIHSRAVTFSRPTTSGIAMPPISRARSGAVSTTPIQKRRVMSTSSALGPSSSATGSRGSSAMPHLGQLPGPTWRTSGCIGHV